ncbi:MAG: flavodoxin family protein [Methanomicrobiales archaeon]|nr:flavodoxin family protein [Methanomicrobiales archaeon]
MGDRQEGNDERLVLERVRSINGEICTIRIFREDLTSVYPGMVRFTVRLDIGGQEIAVFRTNTYEYPPTVSLRAESEALRKAEEWEQELRGGPGEAVEYLRRKPRIRCTPAEPPTDAVVIQGSPRAGGNCSVLARWCRDAVEDLRKTARVIHADDLFIRPCIGCYQCYNSGVCIYEDDMAGVIHAIRHAGLVIVCSPVYTNTVPGSLKLLIDRCQSYHAERTLSGGPTGQKGLVLSVAGRKGPENFRCVTPVLNAFLRNLGIQPSGEIRVDDMDRLRDVQKVPGMEDRVKGLIRACMQEYSG